MSRRRSSEAGQERHARRGNADAERQVFSNYNGDDAAVSEDDLAVLCQMHATSVKNMLRPDTSGIGKAFDRMMDGVKRRSPQRHQDTSVAIERSFATFSGSHGTSVSVREFARTLSFLSIAWSGNFSKEEHLALAQDIGDKDAPGTITLESFSNAANVRAATLATEHFSHRERQRIADYRLATAMNASERVTDHAGDDGADGCHVYSYEHEVGDARDAGTRTAESEEMRENDAQHALETTLQQAASRARSAGQDVWELLDTSIQESLARARDVEDDDTPTSDDVAAESSLSPEILRRFLSKLAVTVLPSPSPPLPLPPPLPYALPAPADESARNPHNTPEERRPRRWQHQQHQRWQDQQLDETAADCEADDAVLDGTAGGDNRKTISPITSVRNADEEGSRGSRKESSAEGGSSRTSPSLALTPPASGIRNGGAPRAGPAESGALIPSPSSLSPLAEKEAAQEETGEPPICERYLRALSNESSTATASVCNRYLRDLSSETMTVRGRVKFLNQELARTQKEAESLIRRGAAGTANPADPKSPPPPPEEGSIVNRGESEDSQRLSLEMDGRRRSPSPSSDGRGGGEKAPVAVEVGDKVVARSSSRVGDAGCQTPRICPRSGTVAAFSRLSPVERADPSHPRFELKSRPGGTPRNGTAGTRPSSPSMLAQKSQVQQHPGHGTAAVAAADVGDDVGATSPGSVPPSSNGEEAVIVKNDRVAKLMLSAFADARGKAAPSPTPSPAAGKRTIAATPKAACFDPPSVRNGFRGLTTAEVDRMLLRVEASTPGALCSWKSPVGANDSNAIIGRGTGIGVTESLMRSTGGRESRIAEVQRARRRLAGHSREASLGRFDARGALERDRGKGGNTSWGNEFPETERGRGAGGGGRRGVRPIMKVDRPPRSSLIRPDSDLFRITPTAVARQLPFETRKYTRDFEGGSGREDDEETPRQDLLSRSYSAYARPSETVVNGARTRRARPASRRQTTTEKNGGDYGRYNGEFAATTTGATRAGRRPQRAYLRLDSGTYHEFLNCAKTQKATRAARGKGRGGARRAFV